MLALRSLGLGVLLALAVQTLAASRGRSEEVHPCDPGATLATGAPDPAIFAREASRGIRAFWCETYDEDGNARRSGVYWESYPDGTARTRARYVDSQIAGGVEIFDEDGALWLRGELAAGDWTGPLEIFHANGERWLAARFAGGQLDGPVETRFPDGTIESRTQFQRGREDGVATSYFPASVGGGLRSQVRVEGDEIVELRPLASPADLGPRPVARLDAAAAAERATGTPRVDASPNAALERVSDPGASLDTPTPAAAPPDSMN